MENLEETIMAAQQADKKLTKQEMMDLGIAVGSASNVAFSQEGQQALMQGLQSADPVMAAGQFLAMAMLNTNDQLMQQGLNVSPRIWMSKGGFLDSLADDVVGIANANGVDIPMDAMPSITMEAMEVLKGMYQGDQQQAQGGGQPQQGAPQGPAPQQQAPPMGGQGLEAQMMGGM